MKQGQHTPEKILQKLRQAAADRAQGCTIREVCKRLEISQTTYRRWKRQYKGVKAYDEVRFGEQAERSTESRDFDENQNDWWHFNRSALSAPLHIGASVSLQRNFSSKSFGDRNHIDTCVSNKIRTRWCEDLGWTHSSVHARRFVPSFYFLTAFLVGLFIPVTIDLVGKLPISELLLLIVLAHAALAFLTTRALPAPLPSPRVLAFVLLCQLVAFASYIVSDLWRESLPFDFVRGWVRMIFLPLNIAALALLFGAGNRTFVLLHIGLVCSFVFPYLGPPLFHDYWKFCFGYPVTLVILLVIPRLLGLWATVGATVGLGVLHLLLKFRSLGATCLLIAALVVVANTLPRLWRKYLFIICTPILVIASPWALESLLTGSQGTATRSNVERSAMIQAAWEGFLRSPLIGNGSWFSKSDVWDNFMMIRAQKERESGQGLGFDPRDFEGIAIHSQILTALAEGGILGGTFFLMYTFLILAGFWFMLTDASWHYLMPLRLLILVSGLYGVFMDPFSGTSRLSIGITVALSLVLLAEKALISRSLRATPTAYSRQLLPRVAPSKPS
jgi:hypothetical protein